MPAIVDLFSAFAVRGQGEPELDADGLQKVLTAVGEHPTPETLRRIFTEADTDRSGTIDLAEFLAASDRILGQSPVTRVGVRARARARVVAQGQGMGPNRDPNPKPHPHQARTILVVGGPGSGKGLLCERLARECATSHVSCGEMLREEVERPVTPKDQG